MAGRRAPDNRGRGPARGRGRLNAGSIPDPAVAATIKRTIGSVYLNLGHLPEADTLLHAALAEQWRWTGPASGETAESYRLGGLYHNQGKYDSAGLAYERAWRSAGDSLVPATR